MIKKFSRKLGSGIKDKDNKELVKGGAAAFIMRIFSIAINYLFTFFIARFYGAGDLGIFTLYQKILQFANAISKMGFDTLLMRSTASYAAQNNWSKIKDLYHKTLLFIVPVSLIISLILFLFSGFIASTIFLKPELKMYCQLAAFSVLPLTILGIHADCLRGLKQIVLYSFIKGASVGLFGCMLLCAAFFFYHNDSLPVYAYFAGLIITAIISTIWWRQKSGLSQIPVKEKDDFKNSIWVALTLYSGGLLQTIRSVTNIFLLGRFGTTEDVGIFNLSLRISTVTSIMLTAILIMVSPKIAELYATGNIKKIAIVSQNATKIIFWTSVPLLLIFIFFPEFILGFFGHGFRSGWMVLIILSVGQFINAATGPVGNVLTMTGKQKAFTRVLLISTIIGVVLNFILIPYMGAEGAAYVNLISLCISNIVPLFIVKHYYGFYTINFKTLFSFKLASE